MPRNWSTKSMNAIIKFKAGQFTWLGPGPSVAWLRPRYKVRGETVSGCVYLLDHKIRVSCETNA